MVCGVLVCGCGVALGGDAGVVRLLCQLAGAAGCRRVVRRSLGFQEMSEWLLGCVKGCWVLWPLHGERRMVLVWCSGRDDGNEVDRALSWVVLWAFWRMLRLHAAGPNRSG